MTDQRTITVARHQEDTQSKAASSLFPINIMTKLERTKRNVLQNKAQTQNPTMGAIISNEILASLSHWVNPHKPLAGYG